MDYTSQSTKHDSENSKLKPVLKLTIEDILSEDLFVEELKNYPSTFLNKHITQEMIKKMISYIICEFSEEQLSEILKEKLKKNPDIRIESFKDVIYNLYSKKFPYNVSEILASDNPIILDFFFDPLKNEDHFEDLDDSPNQKSTNNSNEIENENKYELLDYFFNFLNCEKDLDVILCSYFLKIFTRFIISRSDQLMKYLGLRPTLIKHLFYHIHKKAICDILSRILSSRFLEANIQNEILIKIFDSMNSENQDTIFSISGLMEDVMQNFTFIDSLLESSTNFEKIHIILINFDSNSTNYKEILHVFIKLYEIFTETPKYKTFDFKQIHLENIEKLSLNIKDNFLNNSGSNIPTAFNTSINTLGLKKLYEFQLLVRIIRLCNLNKENRNKQNIIKLLENIMTLSFFEKTLKNLLEYQWNNLYQNEFFMFIYEITSKDFPIDITENLFSSTNFIKTMINCILENGFSFNSGRKINSGYIPIVFQILEHLSSCNNITLKKLLTKDDKWEIFNKSLLQPYIEKINRGLLSKHLNNNNNFIETKIRSSIITPSSQGKRISKFIKFKQIVVVLIGVLMYYLTL